MCSFRGPVDNLFSIYNRRISSLSNVHALIIKNWNRWRPGRSTIPGDQGRTTPKLDLWHGVFTDRFIFRHISEYLSRENGISAPSVSAPDGIRYQKGKLNAFKSSEISLLVLQVLLTGLWDLLYVNLNSRQNCSKNKLVSRPYLIPLGCSSWSLRLCSIHTMPDGFSCCQEKLSVSLNTFSICDSPR